MCALEKSTLSMRCVWYVRNHATHVVGVLSGCEYSIVVEVVRYVGVQRGTAQHSRQCCRCRVHHAGSAQETWAICSVDFEGDN